MLTVNDQKVTFRKDETLTQLLHRCHFMPERVAVEVDEKLVKRANFDHTYLQDGAKVEIFSFVGGG